MNKIAINNFNQLNKNSNIVFFTGSNYSLLLFKIIISLLKIQSYKIIFCGNNSVNFFKFYQYLKFNEKDLLIIKGKYNYSYFNFFMNKKSILHKINKFLFNNNFDYITSYNYGLVNYLIKDNFNISSINLLEDGVVNLINQKTKYLLLKKIIYSLIFKKIVYLPKVWQKDKNIFTKIVTTQHKVNQEKLNFNQFFNDYINNNKVKLKINHKNYNILILCAKKFHYKNGIENFLYKVFESSNQIFSDGRKNKKIKIYVKIHPADISNNLKIFNSKIIKLKKDFIPIEFFDLSIFDLILSPPNTSVINIKINNLFNKNNLYYYDINQHEIRQKYFLMKKYKINNIII